MKNKPIIMVLEGPSGAGKDTVTSELVKKYPGKYIKMISSTSRKMRDDESQGKPYLFLSRKEFEKRVESGDIFEYTIMSRDGEYRGMSREIIDKNIEEGLIQIKDCDPVGIRALRKAYKGCVVAIYLDVKKEEIEKRLRSRGGSEEEIIARLNDFDEYSKISEMCDYKVKNDEVDKCVKEINEIVEDL